MTVLAIARKLSGLAIAGAIIFLLNGCGGSSSSNHPAATATPTATATPVADTIQFSPTATQLTTGTPSQFTIDMTAFDSTGAPIVPSNANKLMVNVYGVQPGVITPASSALSSGSSVTFTYSGGAVPNNVLIDAWISDPTTTNTTRSSAIGQTLVLPSPNSCATATQDYSVNLTGTLPGDLMITAAVGYTNPGDIPSPAIDYPVDTGSLGTIVSQGEIAATQSGPGSFVIGPGPAGTTCYDSSNNAYWGNYYLAPVDFLTTSGWQQTHPIMVLAPQFKCHVTSCSGLPLTPPCSTPAGPEVDYLGVGYGRESSNPGELFESPAQNAFLQVTDANDGTDIGPGYVLTTSGLTVGINSTTPGGFATQSLTPDPAHPGDFQLITGSFNIPNSSTVFSGNGIFDVGISEMLLKLPMSQWPAGTFTAVPTTTCESGYGVPANVAIGATLGNSGSPLLQYNFTTGGTVSGDVPSTVCWQDTTGTPLANTPIVNTGRNPLNCNNYFYQGQCGVVGFNQISPAPTGCP